jgi:hypothetical protein
MPQLLTPTLTVVASGFLDNKGLAPSANILAAVNSFNSSATVLSSQEILAMGNVSLRETVTAIPSCLTGKVSSNLQASVPESIRSQFYFDNLIKDIKNQIDLVMTGGVPGLISTMSRVQIYCSDTFDLKGMFTQMQEGSFDDFGVTVNDYTDVITGGVNSQFATLIGGLNNSSAREMLTQLGNFGTMFDISEPGRIYDPKVLCQNLINQGFYLVNELLTKGGIDVVNLAIADEKQLLAVMGTISGTELSAIIAVTNFKPYGSIKSLADVLDSTRLFSPKALVAAGGSLKELANKLINVGGKFKSFKDLSETYLNIKATPTPNLAGVQRLGTNSLFDNAKLRLPAGTGLFGNPTIYDYIGVLTGEGYIEDIASLIDIQNQLVSTDEGLAFKNALAARPVNQTLIAQTTEALVTSNKTQIQTLLNQGENKFNSIFTRLFKERTNSKINGILYEETTGTPDSVTSFALGLHDVWSDPKNLRYGEFITKITTTDIFGEAIRASIEEGFNLALLAQKNIPVYTKLDPVAYSNVVKARPDC